MKTFTFKVFLFFSFVFFVSTNVMADYYSVAGYVGDYDSPESWDADKGTIPDSQTPNSKMWITSGSVITVTGDLTPNIVEVSGRLIVNGDYNNTQWSEGLTIKSGGFVEVTGCMRGQANVSVEAGGTLIVRQDYISSEGNDISVQGTLIVKGSFSSASSAEITVEGKLVVGGDFNHLNGNFHAGNDRLYIINPDAEISLPEGWSEGDKANYGTLDDFMENEANNETLIGLLEDLDLISPDSGDIPTEIRNSQRSSDALINIESMNGRVSISIDEKLLRKQSGQIEVYNLSGAKITEFQASTNKTFIVLPEAPGVYLVVVKAGGKMKSKKLVR